MEGLLDYLSRFGVPAVALDRPVEEETCPLDPAPMMSTTACTI